MSLDTIHHIAIQVANLQEAINWYTSSFRCKLVHQDKREAILEFENTKLLLTLPSMQQRHIAFRREDAESFGELRPQTDGSQGTAVSDPTGNIVKIIKQNVD